MNKEDFVKTINQLMLIEVDKNNLNKALRAFDPDFNFLTFSRYKSIILNVLTNLFNDKDDWIGYYIYELDYGRKYKKGMITNNGKNVKLKTPSDLYNLLIETNFNK